MAVPKVWHLFGEEHLPYRLLLLSRMIDRETQRRLIESFDLTLAEWRLLAIACALGPCTASEVGEVGQIDRAEISRALGKLEPAGLLERVPDPNHGRRKIITPTAEGQKLHDKVRDERRGYFRDIMAGLSAEQRTELDACLLSIAEHVSAQPENPDEAR